MRLIRILCACLMVFLLALPCSAARPRKRKPGPQPAVPQVTVVGDTDVLEEYREEDDDQPPAPETQKPDWAAKLEPPDGPPHWVTVTCDKPDLVRSATLRVIWHEPLANLDRLCSNTVTFEPTGSCRIKLSQGTYAFEVLGGQETTLVALRTGLMAIGRDMEVPLKTAAPPGDEEESVEVVLTPGQNYRSRALGVAGETAYALWQPLTSATPRLEAPPGAVTTCKFRWAPGGPKATGGATFSFPDSELSLPMTPATTFLTNRRYVMMFYWMETAPFRKIVVHERGYALPKPGATVTHDLGGPLQTTAGSVIVLHRRPSLHQIVCFADLRDARGHIVDGEHSTIGLKSVLRVRGGRELGPKELLGEEETLRTLLATLESVIRYDLDGTPVERITPLTGLAPMTSEHFRLNAPAQGDWRGESYLMKLERIHRILEDVTGRSPKRQVHVSWHTTSVDLGGRGLMAMTLGGLRDSWGFFKYPWAIVHEMLHAFGYPHGDEMRFRHRLALERLRAYRWQLADHPEQVPEGPQP